MRVLIPTPDFPPAHGGIQVLLERLAHHLDDHQVLVVTPSQDGEEKFDRELPYRVVRVSGPGGRHGSLLALNARLPFIAARFGADAIVSGHIVCGPGSLLARGRQSIPLVQYVHAMEMTSRSTLARLVLPRVDVTIAVSGYAKRIALDAGARPARIALSNPGVDPPPQEREPAAEPVILSIARLKNHYKGIDVMLRAMPLVLAQVPDARWVVLGDGPLRAGLERTTARMGLASHVSFGGPVSDAERDRWFARAQVFALPSRVPPGGAGEGFGIVFLEAGRFGVPSVTANEGGAAEAVVDGVTGTHVDPRNHVALATAITDLLLNRELRERYGSAARARSAELSWAEMARRVERTLHSLHQPYPVR